MKIFIGGPRAISRLNQDIKERLNNIFRDNYTVLVGDANGIDKAIQKHCYESNYYNVNVYATNGKARNNIGNWEVVKVMVSSSTKDFEYYSAKDKEMAKVADYGFMIWNGKSKGTLNNLINLASYNKKALVYFTPNRKFYTIKNISEIETFVGSCDEITKKNFSNLSKQNEQMMLNI
ncbi:hypothetical protein CACET_c15230 [Clostridium aceticum]|uniref:Uncharacterized protein n=1 Tax=Clostridium aceticum TaxID=84022 RepID=A0A0D8ID44_9CLOT|nr:hypothetical protein [Clostridium aceticum]AKL94972.1 hypothetical protein CACET_c15230 [Clostridium aceticum]KJF27882.1 hypothetical protein TZ02_04690 [Clostridium aceticum]